MNRVPPKILPRKNQFSWLAAILFFVAIIMVATTVFFFDPATHVFYPGCTFHKLTGLNCPGCGATRSLHALLHGEWQTALRDNALFIGAILFFGGRSFCFWVNHFRGRVNGSFFSTKWLWPSLLLVAIFSVLRNLPAFNFLSP